MARFMIKLAPKTYIGPFINYRVTQARNIEDDYAYLWQGQDKTVRAYTAGVSFTYDSRDFMLNASHGIFCKLTRLSRLVVLAMVITTFRQPKQLLLLMADFGRGLYLQANYMVCSITDTLHGLF